MLLLAATRVRAFRGPFERVEFRPTLQAAMYLIEGPHEPLLGGGLVRGNWVDFFRFPQLGSVTWRMRRAVA
jgi:hypothetical protein